MITVTLSGQGDSTHSFWPLSPATANHRPSASLTTCYGWGCFFYPREDTLGNSRCILQWSLNQEHWCDSLTLTAQNKNTEEQPQFMECMFLPEVRDLPFASMPRGRQRTLLLSLLSIHISSVRSIRENFGRREGGWGELNHTSQGQGNGQTRVAHHSVSLSSYRDCMKCHVAFLHLVFQRLSLKDFAKQQGRCPNPLLNHHLSPALCPNSQCK